MDSRVKRHALGYLEATEKPTPNELRAYYEERYFQQESGSYRASYSPEEMRYFEAKLTQKRARIESLRGAGPGRMLDVGCGEGFALAHFRRAGWQVEGVDYSAAGVTAMNPSCMDVLVTGDIVQILGERFTAGVRYDVIMLTNVLEHLIDPPRMMRELRNLLADNGVAAITVPNDFSRVQRALIDSARVNTCYWIALPDHLAYFDRESLVALATATGWKCHDVLAEFPIDWFLFHPGSNYVEEKSAGGDAHRARVAIENLISERPVEHINRFYSAMGALGMGRDITAFLLPEVI